MERQQQKIMNITVANACVFVCVCLSVCQSNSDIKKVKTCRPIKCGCIVYIQTAQVYFLLTVWHWMGFLNVYLKIYYSYIFSVEGVPVLRV